jgi:squalene-hopene/tetraprenyl-beta-curcumene cyclase
VNIDRLRNAYRTARTALLAERTPEGFWLGELSASALSTATAVSALTLIDKHGDTPERHSPLIAGGLAWLAAHQNDDGGWGDTVKSVTNISTTMLCRAAFQLAAGASRYADCVQRAEAYLAKRYGSTPERQAEAVRARYGKDHTFAVPILTTCALAGLVSWREVPSLPFELACLPQAWFRFLQLPVVSYALPALVAIGQAVYHHRPPRNPIARLVRRLAIRKSLRVLEAIQPSSGGFLEATPLTSFVTLSLASIGQRNHPVARKAVEFLVRSVLADGSWAIDSNLSVWVTTLAINALASADDLGKVDRLEELRAWLLRQQFHERHPYTGADPGAWGWTHLPGSVPDADDTPGALLALAHLPETDTRNASAVAGLRWLLDLQNRDGGWPTFCRGWGNLPFDRSGPDLTAHALRALTIWSHRLDAAQLIALHRATQAGLRFLERTQRPDGAWLPLWFGNQYAQDDENPTYGTARVLAAYRDLDMMDSEAARRGVAWLLHAQNADGGWGGGSGTPSTVEETALAVEVLLNAGSECEPAVNNALRWLVEQVENGALACPAPIGFYFAKLWYFEKLYPIIFTVAALGRAVKLSRCRETVPRDGTP